MTLEQFQNLKIGDIVVAKLVNSKQSRVNPVTNIDRGNLKLHIGKSGKWRSYLQFEVLTADYVVKWIKRRIDSKSSPHFTIEVKSDTEVTFKVHKKYNSINEKVNRTTKVRRQILFNMPYLLLTFLIKERVLDRFLDNTSKYAIVHSINLSCLYTKLRDPYAAIECTFAWDCTKEGYDFGKDLMINIKVYGK